MEHTELPREVGEKALSLATKMGSRVTSIHLFLDSKVLRVSGVLSDIFEGSPAPSHVKSTLVANSVKRLVIDARSAAADPTGVQYFKIFANESLKDFALVFLPSQLADILRFDDQYDHPDSEFLESDLPTPVAEDQPTLTVNIFSIPVEALEILGLAVDDEGLPVARRRMVEVSPNKRYREELATRFGLSGQYALCF